MSVDAYALLRLTPRTRDLDELLEVDPFFRGDDHVVVDLGARYSDVQARPRRYAIALAQQWRAVLAEHDDERGVLVVHDAGDLEGDSYAAIVKRWNGDGGQGGQALWLPNLAAALTGAARVAKRLAPKDVPLLPMRGATGLRFTNLAPARAVAELSLAKAPAAVAQYVFSHPESPSEIVAAYEAELRRLRLRTKREVLSDGSIAQVVGRSKARAAYVNAERRSETAASAVTITWIEK